MLDPMVYDLRKYPSDMKEDFIKQYYRSRLDAQKEDYVPDVFITCSKLEGITDSGVLGLAPKILSIGIEQRTRTDPEYAAKGIRESLEKHMLEPVSVGTVAVPYTTRENDMVKRVAEELGAKMPFLPVSAINGIRRECASRLDGMPLKAIRMYHAAGPINPAEISGPVTYKSNVANTVTEKIYSDAGADSVERAYEITHRPGAELMRTKYCIRYELGMCPVHQHVTPPERLYLLNNGKRYSLSFDCARCEMTVL